MSNWFDVVCGLKLGDNFSTRLARFYLSDTATEIKQLNCGVQYGTVNVPLLMYADDIVFIAESEMNLQMILKTFESWCNKWQTNCNLAKPK